MGGTYTGGREVERADSGGGVGQRMSNPLSLKSAIFQLEIEKVDERAFPANCHKSW